jgi:sulfur-carrier protein adenylyltransferase/sulfurtransferase
MGLRDYFIPAAALSADETRDYLRTRPQGSYTLLDVRQPGEYEQEHIPGARLVPLPRLGQTLGELPKDRPVIVYCAIGGRSRVAAQLLAGQGFAEVYNLTGGIKAWNGHTAMGPPDLHLCFLRNIQSPAEACALAWHLEEAQRIFYGDLQHSLADEECARLFGDLARNEQRHKERVLGLCKQYGLAPGVVENLDESLIEGGLNKREFIERNQQHLQTVEGCVTMAMMLETQALDLYLRLAAETEDTAVAVVLRDLAREETLHLEQLGRLLSGG